MREPLGPLLSDARAGGYAVGSFTVVDLASARGVFEAIALAEVPAIVSITRRMTPFMDVAGLAAYLVRRSEESTTAVAIHLDHGTDLDLVRRVLDLGFTSVQYDAPGEPFVTKVERTRTAVELAHRYGATAEAELEHIGRDGVEDGGGLTQPDLAARFASATGIDVLAPAIGSTHGFSRGRARLDLALLAELSEAVGCHLSLHGGTGVAPSELVDAIRGGIVKVSYFHGMAEAAVEALRAGIGRMPHGDLAALLDVMRPPFRDRCLEMIGYLGGPGRPAGLQSAGGAMLGAG